MADQKIVMLYTFSDGYTYSCDRVFPLMSESPEQALCDFEDAYNAAKKTDTATLRPGSFKFAGVDFNCGDFECEGEYYPPDFLTVDEWFTQYA